MAFAAIPQGSACSFPSDRPRRRAFASRPIRCGNSGADRRGRCRSSSLAMKFPAISLFSGRFQARQNGPCRSREAAVMQMSKDISLTGFTRKLRSGRRQSRRPGSVGDQQVRPGSQRPARLGQAPAGRKVPHVNRLESKALDQRDDQLLCLSVVSGHKQRAVRIASFGPCSKLCIVIELNALTRRAPGA